MFVDFLELDTGFVGKEITVGGFVNSIRDHGGLIFIDLRSEGELLQCVVNPETNKEAFNIAEKLGNESVLAITGRIALRKEDLVNPKIHTGFLELEIGNIEVVSAAKPLPFDIHVDESRLANEDIRLTYRYLDLRRPKLKDMMKKKSNLFLAVRNWFNKENFIEVQTPILANSSPEGARDFLVPSRLHPGKFYALPQAPQQFKQLLMVGGFNRYFQIAPCFRDEDPRADRHPGDFYQIDSEIAWANEDDIYNICWKLIQEVFAPFSDKKLNPEFVKIRFDDAMNRFGSDKPDMRYGLEWQNVKLLFAGSGFQAFAGLCDDEHARVQALVIKNVVNDLSRSDLDKIQDIGRGFGLPGIAYIQYFAEGEKSPIFKFFGDEQAQATKQAEIKAHLGAETGDLVLFLAHAQKELVFKVQHAMRKHLGEKLGLIDENVLKFVWIYDFPFFEADDKTGVLDFAHNPFGVFRPFDGKTALETLEQATTENTLLDLRAVQYDIAANGFEVLSGGRRNSDPECLMKAFMTVGYTKEEVQSKFGHMMEAYGYGAPYHAGFAWGIDRLFMVLIGEDNIRETIAFPKNGSGIDLMMSSPNTVREKQLKELHIKLA